MKKMRFSEKQNDVTIATPEEGVTDVIILQNETKVTEKDERAKFFPHLFFGPASRRVIPWPFPPRWSSLQTPGWTAAQAVGS